VLGFKGVRGCKDEARDNAEDETKMAAADKSVVLQVRKAQLSAIRWYRDQREGTQKAKGSLKKITVCLLFPRSGIIVPTHCTQMHSFAVSGRAHAYVEFT
jgi:hypothetical protein